MGKGYRIGERFVLRSPLYSFHAFDPHRLPELLLDPIFQQAVHLASPALHRALERKDFRYDQLNRSEKASVYHYYNRMCFRPVPFGSFATFSVCRQGNWPVLLSGISGIRLSLLEDNRTVWQKQQQATTGTLILNPCLYRLGDRFRFPVSSPNEKGAFEYFLESIAAERATAALFRYLKPGRRYDDTLKWLRAYAGCEVDEARSFLDFLVNAQAIYTPARQELIEPAGPASGDEPVYALADRPVVSGGVDASTGQELLQAVDALRRLSPAAGNTDLLNFKAAFRRRFDAQMVPLLHALDPDAGIGFGEPAGDRDELVSALARAKMSPASKILEWTPAHGLLLDAMSGKDPYAPAALDADKVAALSLPAGELPPTSSVLFRKTGEGLLIEHCGAVNGPGVTGRFTLVSDEITAICRELAAAEAAANPEVIFAELSQLSDLHVDNINRRLPIYPYRILLNTFAEPGTPGIILPEELSLFLQGEELILYSIRHQKRVIPRLPTAYNFANDPSPIFRLLCELQYQGLDAGWTFDPEAFLPGRPFYPRFVLGDVILRPACWHFRAEALESLSAVHVSTFRKKHRLPQWISCGQGDRQLIFNLTEADEAAFFADYARKQKHLSISEYLLSDRSVKGTEGPLATQFVAFLIGEEQVFTPANTPLHPVKAKTKRMFLPGSEWLFIRLDCTPERSDELLQKLLVPVIMQFGQSIEKWFFIRYDEGGHHLRIRFLMAPADQSALMSALQGRAERPIISGLVRSISIAAYERELERYGPELITFAEAIFHRSSTLLLRYRGHVPMIDILQTVRMMVFQFFTDEKEATAFIGRMASAFEREFAVNKDIRIRMDAAYRQYHRDLRAQGAGEWRPAAISAAATYKQLKKDITLLRHLAAQKDMQGRHSLLAGLVHMHLNRCFYRDQREQELMVYYFLRKYMGGPV